MQSGAEVMAAKAQLVLEMDDKGAVRVLDQTTGRLQKLGQVGNVVMTGLTKQQKQAREAAQLLSNALGVQVPSGLEKIIAKSRILAPALSAAFNTAVVIAFVAALGNFMNNIDAYHKKLRDLGRGVVSLFSSEL